MASEKVLTLTADNIDSTISGASAPLLVDFWAEWCGPCKMIAPVLDELAEELDGQASIGKVDIDQFPQLAEKYGVTSIPTLIVFKGGEIADTLIGLRSKNELKERLVG